MHAPDAVREPVATRHRPSGLTVFLSAFVAGAVVSFGINHFVDAQVAQNRPQVECEPIFVALRSLPQGAPVTVWDVALKDWPLAMLPTSALRAEDSFEGTVLRYPLREGQPLLAVQLVKAPTDHAAIAADVEMFKQPTPAATRRAPLVESDAWLPEPKMTSIDVSPANPVVVEPVDSTVSSAQDDGRDDKARDDASALPLVAIAATPIEMTVTDPGPTAADDPAPPAVVEVVADAIPALAKPPADVLPLIDDPFEGVVATDEPRPFVAARRPRTPVAPQPQLDIADSIAALTRARSSSTLGSSLAVSPDTPTTSVLLTEPEIRDAEPTFAAPSGELPGDAIADVANVMAEDSDDVQPADTATAQADAEAPTPAAPAMPMPIPRYLVIPERIALEADAFFGPTTAEAESRDESTKTQPAARDQAESASRPRLQYEAPPVTNPPPPTLSEMFPNIANGIDALSGPFRGRSAQQPRRTR